MCGWELMGGWELFIINENFRLKHEEINSTKAFCKQKAMGKEGTRRGNDQWAKKRKICKQELKSRFKRDDGCIDRPAS
jgi:hypothetical protein